MTWKIGQAFFGMEGLFLDIFGFYYRVREINIRSLRSIAKIAGQSSAGGAISMNLLKGPKLLNTEFLPAKSAFGSGGQNWLLGLHLFFCKFHTYFLNEIFGVIQKLMTFECSLVGAVAVIIGLYVVLWGKAKDLEESQTVSNPELQNNEAKNVRVLIDESSNKTSCTIDLK
ncbi:hypothetical protein CK203_046699 [Vitis vinifera]|uniref:WAT1-related protein n=1 Tax=Vitis vinifera TaxID=29760 RepID=A0A438HJX4_VITVI|nr:hypothetical protein CK203_046699 [Vitis vinifera]